MVLAHWGSSKETECRPFLKLINNSGVDAVIESVDCTMYIALFSIFLLQKQNKIQVYTKEICKANGVAVAAAVDKPR